MVCVCVCPHLRLSFNMYLNWHTSTPNKCISEWIQVIVCHLRLILYPFSLWHVCKFIPGNRQVQLQNQTSDWSPQNLWSWRPWEEAAQFEVCWSPKLSYHSFYDTEKKEVRIILKVIDSFFAIANSLSRSKIILTVLTTNQMPNQQGLLYFTKYLFTVS